MAFFGVDADTLRGQAAAAGRRTASDVLRVFYASYAASRDKPRWGEKIPFYAIAMPWIPSLLEEAHLIHIIRDGNAMKRCRCIPLWWGPTSVPEAAAWWAERVHRGRRAGADLRFLEVRYEQLVDRPEAELGRICGSIGLDFDLQMPSFNTRVRESRPSWRHTST